MFKRNRMQSTVTTQDFMHWRAFRTLATYRDARDNIDVTSVIPPKRDCFY